MDHGRGRGPAIGSNFLGGWGRAYRSEYDILSAVLRRDALFNQAVFLQDIGGFVWQQVGGFTAGTYTLSFYLGSRSGYDGNQTVVALIDGTPIGTWALTTGTPFTLETVRFTVSTGGSHALEFIGTRPGDHTAFLSYVTIASD